MAALFVIAIILGAVVKVEAAKYVTIGFNDYRVENQKQEYDFSAMEKASIKRAQEGESAPTAPLGGAACGA